MPKFVIERDLPGAGAMSPEELHSPGLIEEHARCGGFPANRISEVRTMIDPTTAEA